MQNKWWNTEIIKKKRNSKRTLATTSSQPLGQANGTGQKRKANDETPKSLKKWNLEPTPATTSEPKLATAECPKCHKFMAAKSIRRHIRDRHQSDAPNFSCKMCGKRTCWMMPNCVSIIYQFYYFFFKKGTWATKNWRAISLRQILRMHCHWRRSLGRYKRTQHGRKKTIYGCPQCDSWLQTTSNYKVHWHIFFISTVRIHTNE